MQNRKRSLYQKMIMLPEYEYLENINNKSHQASLNDNIVSQIKLGDVVIQKNGKSDNSTATCKEPDKAIRKDKSQGEVIKNNQNEKRSHSPTKLNAVHSISAKSSDARNIPIDTNIPADEAPAVGLVSNVQPEKKSAGLSRTGNEIQKRLSEMEKNVRELNESAKARLQAVNDFRSRAHNRMLASKTGANKDEIVVNKLTAEKLRKMGNPHLYDVDPINFIDNESMPNNSFLDSSMIQVEANDPPEIKPEAKPEAKVRRSQIPKPIRRTQLKRVSRILVT